VDALLAAVVIGVVSAAIATSSAVSARPLWVAYAFAVAFGMLMFARRAQPVLVVAYTCLGLVAYYAAGFPRIGLAVPVAAALYSAAEAGFLWAAVAGALGLLAYTYEYRLHAGQDARFLLGYELATNVAILAAVIALGDSVRSRRRLVAEQDEVLRRREAEKEADARRRVADERLRIARELHDAVGHTVVALSLHTNAALEALDAHEQTAARTAMQKVHVAASHTMRELRASVGLLRRQTGRAHELSTTADADTAGGLADIDLLFELLDARGVQPRVTISSLLDGADRRPAGLAELTTLAADLPAEVDAAAYRIVQESTTNAIRHADPRTIDLEFRRSPASLEIRVFNDGGVAGAARPTAGHGLTGMRERAEALGGTLRAAPAARGFLVVATLPLTTPTRAAEPGVTTAGRDE
jgi:signal transduction histidine kinase